MKKNVVAMKKSAPRFVDDTHVLVTKEFAKNAKIFGTAEYKLWKEIRQDCEEAVMVTKTIKKNPNKKNDTKNMTYERMAIYIREQNDAATLMVEFKKQIALSKVQTNPYRSVLAWFMQTFQNYDSYNRKVLQSAIESLVSKGFITRDSSGRTQTLKVIPKATEITIPKRWVQSVVRHDYSSEAVAAAPVLKVFLWIVQNTQGIVTNDMIAADLGVSVSTVVSAKNVLEREYENITKRKISTKLGDDVFRSLGQELEASALWNDV